MKAIDTNYVMRALIYKDGSIISAALISEIESSAIKIDDLIQDNIRGIDIDIKYDNDYDVICCIYTEYQADEMFMKNKYKLEEQ
ncbi:MAG: hypothetical protein AABY32_00715 [Nanoarchaeota archaeon]